MNYSLFLRDSKLWAAQLPEEPITPDEMHWVNCQCDICKRIDQYSLERERALSEALGVVNEYKIYTGDNVLVALDIDWHKTFKLKVGEYYAWPGKVEIVERCGSRGNAPAVGCSACHGSCQFRNKAIKLLPLSGTSQPEQKDKEDREIIEHVFPEVNSAMSYTKVHDAFQTFEACNWPEDYEHENGNYTNKCCTCNFYFKGNKRRVQCKMCASDEPDWEKLILKKAPDLGGAYAGCWLDGEMTGYARCMVKHVLPLRKSQSLPSASEGDAYNQAIEDCKTYLYKNGRQVEGRMLLNLKKVLSEGETQEGLWEEALTIWQTYFKPNRALKELQSEFHITRIKPESKSKEQQSDEYREYMD